MAEPVILNNRYRLEERLGTGGMAVVYRAHDDVLERTVAIKVLRTDFSKDTEFRQRFSQEAKAVANLPHPNIVTIHDFGLDAEHLFIVMEFVPGTDLKTILQRRGRMGLDDALALMVQACAGLGYAHRAGLVHCDVKPQNMLVTPDRRLKVVDFGIARALASIMPDEKTDVVWGSPQYFSPEQAAGGAPSPASDVYSLGVVLFEMLTGQLPFNASSPEELARLHRESLPPSPRRLNPAIPTQLEQIMIKVLSKEPAARYRTADQLGRVLITFTQQSAAVAPIQPAQFPEPAEGTPTRPSPPPVETRAIAPNPRPTIPAPPVQELPPRPQATVAIPAEQEPPQEFDYLTWFLALLAMIAVLGLIPFCLWVYYVVNPPI